jgi:hypothetical protein
MSKEQTPDQVVLGDKTALVENIFHQGLKKTSMQELFNNLESIDIKVPIGVKKVFLDKEEEQIADAFYSGYEDSDLFQHGHDYYNKTYGKL